MNSLPVSFGYSPVRVAFLVIAFLGVCFAGAIVAQQAEADGPTRVNLPDASVDDVLSFYEQLTGKTVLRSAALAQVPPIRLVTPKPVSREEAVQLVEALLMINGVAIVDDPASGAVRVLPIAGGAKGQVFSDSLEFYTNVGDLPSGDRLVGYFMEMDSVEPSEAVRLLTDHVGLNPFGRLTPSGNGIIITESASVVRQLVEVKALIDVPDGSGFLENNFVELVHADATTVAETLQEMIDARFATGGKISGAGGRGSVGGPAGAIGGGGRGLQSANTGRSGPGTPTSAPQLVADPRLNRIMVVSNPREFDSIKELIEQFDKPLKKTKNLRRPLNYASAEDILPVLVDMLMDGSDGKTSPQIQSSNRTGAVTGLANGDGGRGISTSGTDANGREDQIQVEDRNFAPTSVLVGKTKIIADPKSNVVLAYGPTESLQLLEDLIDELDRQPPQVYISTVIGQLELGDGIEYGADYLTKFQPFSGSKPDRGGYTGGLVSSRSDGLLGGIADLRDNIVTSPFGPTSGLNIYGQIGNVADAFFTALENSNRFEVISRPCVYASNNEKATLSSGRRIPVPAETLSAAGNNGQNGGLGSVSTSIDFVDVLLKLEVVPLINANGEITLTVSQINDAVVGEQVVATNTIPIIGTEQLTTTVTVPDRSTIVLGGLITEEESTSKSGIPIISRVPILGIPFRKTETNTLRKELIIFIQPTIVSDSQSQIEQSLSEDLRTNVGETAYEKFPQTPKRLKVLKAQALPPQPRQQPQYNSSKMVNQINQAYSVGVTSPIPATEPSKSKSIGGRPYVLPSSQRAAVPSRSTGDALRDFNRRSN